MPVLKAAAALQVLLAELLSQGETQQEYPKLPTCSVTWGTELLGPHTGLEQGPQAKDEASPEKVPRHPGLSQSVTPASTHGPGTALHAIMLNCSPVTRHIHFGDSGMFSTASAPWWFGQTRAESGTELPRTAQGDILGRQPSWDPCTL